MDGSLVIFVLSLFFYVVFVTAVNRSKSVCSTQDCVRAAAFLRANVNFEKNACDDFYEFACGNFNGGTQPEHGKINYSTEITHMINERLSHLLKGKNNSAIEPIKRARMLFQDCINLDDMEPINIILKRFDLNAKPPFTGPLTNENYKFEKTIGKLGRFSIANFPIKFNVAKDPDNKNYTMLHILKPEPLYLPKKEKYISPEKMGKEGITNPSEVLEKEQTKGLVDFVLKMTDIMLKHTQNKLRADKYPLLVSSISIVVRVLINLEKLATKSVTPEKGERLTVDELQKLTDDAAKKKDGSSVIDWKLFINTLFENVESPRQLILNGELKLYVADVEYIKRLVKCMANINDRILQSILWINTMKSFAWDLTHELRTAMETYERNIGNDVLDRETYCVNVVKGMFSNASAIFYSQDKTITNNITKIEEMAEQIKEMHEANIMINENYDERTKMAALNKMSSITLNIAYPSWTKDPANIQYAYQSTFVYPNNYLFSILMEIEYQNEYGFGTISKTENTSDFIPYGDPLAPEIKYSPRYNTLNIPIAALRPPNMGLGLDVLDYGTVGFMMAREMYHAIDMIGAHYNSWGDRFRWWKKATLKKWAENAKCYVEAYENEFYENVKTKVNGERTLNENMADYVGFHIALQTYKYNMEKERKESEQLVNFKTYSDQQLFTLAFASTFCQTESQNTLYQTLLHDTFAPPKSRVNVVAKQSSVFSNIWQCKKDTTMNPKTKCTPW